MNTATRFFTLILLAAMLLAGCAEEEAIVCRNDPPGFLIADAQIIDGSGAPGFSASVRVNAGLITDIGDLRPCDGERVVDGTGQVLAPGFIDTHSHADSGIFEHLDALAAISQGITTVVVGQDGDSIYPLADFFSKLEQTPATINVASYVGHNTIRSAALGEDNRRPATVDEVAGMAKLLESELSSGALGLSSGLEYEPGIYSDPSEVLALARVTASVGGRYISHIRSEDRWLEDAVDEIISIGRETGMPVQISHIKLGMKRLWNGAPEILAKLDAARADGVQITADIYPYEYWQSTMMVLLPERDYKDRDAVTFALDQLAPPEGIWMTKFAPNPDYVGKTITEIAALRKTDAVSAFMQLAEEADLMARETGESTGTIIATSMLESDVHELLTWSETNICTDGSLTDMHPRGTASFTRVLGRYVREQNVIPLEVAINKMTGLSAAHMGFRDRGMIRRGAVADLVLFNPETVIDRATIETPAALSEGITSVWVSGDLVYAAGAATGNRPGKVIRRLHQ
jgi:N-acyl-D-amino-acid deacylase